MPGGRGTFVDHRGAAGLGVRGSDAYRVHVFLPERSRNSNALKVCGDSRIYHLCGGIVSAPIQRAAIVPVRATARQRAWNLAFVAMALEASRAATGSFE